LFIGRSEITAELTDEAIGEIEAEVWEVIKRERDAA
jgi:hypothetical protein